MGGLNFLSLSLLGRREIASYVKMENSAKVSKLCFHALHLRSKLATGAQGGGGGRLVSIGWGRGVRLARRRIGLQG